MVISINTVIILDCFVVQHQHKPYGAALHVHLVKLIMNLFYYILRDIHEADLESFSVDKYNTK